MTVRETSFLDAALCRKALSSGTTNRNVKIWHWKHAVVILTCPSAKSNKFLFNGQEISHGKTVAVPHGKPLFGTWLFIVRS
jgi:hypothetical protein